MSDFNKKNLNDQQDKKTEALNAKTSSEFESNNTNKMVAKDQGNFTGSDQKDKKLLDNEVERLIEKVKSDEDLELSTTSKQNKGESSLKLNKLYKIKFSEFQFRRTILKHIFIPTDAEYVKNFFTKKIEKINGREKTFYYLNDKTLTKKDVDKLNKIARDIKKQKGRINFLPLIASFVVVILILVFAYFFRNIISRKIVVSASESIFGAKCDIGFVDFNLFDTHFQIKDYVVANKNSPMKNLFQIKNIDLYFDLLELSRGKFVCKNIAVDGISWNTDRKISGALPKKEKAKKNENSILQNNPITKMIDDELKRIQLSVSVSNGLQAVREQTDPKLILQRQINAFKSPKIKDEILDFAPTFISSWEAEVNRVYADVQNMIATGQGFVTIDFQNIDSVEKITDAISKLTLLIEATDKNIKNVETLINKIENDAKEIETLAKNAESYIVSDFEHVKKTAADLKEIRTRGVSGFVSDLFKIFYLETLGNYYPRLMYLISKANEMQKTPKKENAPTLASKSWALERLKGRNFLFSDHSSPSLVFNNIQLSANTATKDFTIAGNVQNITNDADRLNKPITMAILSTQKQFKENFTGLVDLRKSKPVLANFKGDFAGLDLDLDANITGLPKLKGAFTTNAEVEIGKNNDLKIITSGIINNASLTIETFEPEFISDIYSQVLSRINTVDLTTSFFKVSGNAPQLKISTTVDEQIFASIQKQLQIELTHIKNMVIAEGKKMLEMIRAEYLPQINHSEEIIELVKLSLTDSKAFEKAIQNKINEANDRIKEITTKAVNKATEKVTEQIDQAQKQVQNEVQKQIENTKKQIQDQLKESLKNPFGW